MIKRFLKGLRKTLIYAGDPVKVYLHTEVAELRKELEWANCKLEDYEGSIALFHHKCEVARKEAVEEGEGDSLIFTDWITEED